MQTGQNISVYTFDVTLTDRDVKGTEGTIVFHNLKKPELKTSVTVTLEEALVIPDYTSIGTENVVRPGIPATETTPCRAQRRDARYQRRQFNDCESQVNGWGDREG